MARSSVVASPGATYNNAIVYAFPAFVQPDNSVRVTGQPTSSVVVASGTFTLAGLTKGTYLLQMILAGVDYSNVLSLGTIAVDGSTTYNI